LPTAIGETGYEPSRQADRDFDGETDSDNKNGVPFRHGRVRRRNGNQDDRHDQKKYGYDRQ
jgi:hypothetical protein